MIYILLSIFTAGLSYLYYHRFKSFERPYLPPAWAIAIVFSFVVSLGAIRCIDILQTGDMQDILILPDIFSKLVAICIFVAIWLWHCWLALSAKWISDSHNGSDGFLFIVLIALSLGIAYAACIPIMLLLQVIV